MKVDASPSNVCGCKGMRRCLLCCSSRSSNEKTATPHIDSLRRCCNRSSKQQQQPQIAVSQQQQQQETSLPQHQQQVITPQQQWQQTPLFQQQQETHLQQQRGQHTPLPEHQQICLSEQQLVNTSSEQQQKHPREQQQMYEGAKRSTRRSATGMRRRADVTDDGAVESRDETGQRAVETGATAGDTTATTANVAGVVAEWPKPAAPTAEAATGASGVATAGPTAAPTEAAATAAEEAAAATVRAAAAAAPTEAAGATTEPGVVPARVVAEATGAVSLSSRPPLSLTSTVESAAALSPRLEGAHISAAGASRSADAAADVITRGDHKYLQWRHRADRCLSEEDILQLYRCRCSSSSGSSSSSRRSNSSKGSCNNNNNSDSNREVTGNRRRVCRSNIRGEALQLRGAHICRSFLPRWGVWGEPVGRKGTRPPHYSSNSSFNRDSSRGLKCCSNMTRGCFSADERNTEEKKDLMHGIDNSSSKYGKEVNLRSSITCSSLKSNALGEAREEEEDDVAYTIYFIWCSTCKRLHQQISEPQRYMWAEITAADCERESEMLSGARTAAAGAQETATVAQETSTFAVEAAAAVEKAAAVLEEAEVLPEKVTATAEEAAVLPKEVAATPEEAAAIPEEAAAVSEEAAAVSEEATAVAKEAAAVAEEVAAACILADDALGKGGRGHVGELVVRERAAEAADKEASAPTEKPPQSYLMQHVAVARRERTQVVETLFTAAPSTQTAAAMPHTREAATSKEIVVGCAQQPASPERQSVTRETMLAAPGARQLAAVAPAAGESSGATTAEDGIARERNIVEDVGEAYHLEQQTKKMSARKGHSEADGRYIQQQQPAQLQVPLVETAAAAKMSEGERMFCRRRSKKRNKNERAERCACPWRDVCIVESDSSSSDVEEEQVIVTGEASGVRTPGALMSDLYRSSVPTVKKAMESEGYPTIRTGRGVYTPAATPCQMCRTLRGTTVGVRTPGAEIRGKCYFATMTESETCKAAFSTAVDRSERAASAVRTPRIIIADIAKFASSNTLASPVQSVHIPQDRNVMCGNSDAADASCSPGNPALSVSPYVDTPYLHKAASSPSKNSSLCFSRAAEKIMYASPKTNTSNLSPSSGSVASNSPPSTSSTTPAIVSCLSKKEILRAVSRALLWKSNRKCDTLHRCPQDHHQQQQMHETLKIRPVVVGEGLVCSEACKTNTGEAGSNFYGAENAHTYLSALSQLGQSAATRDTTTAALLRDRISRQDPVTEKDVVVKGKGMFTSHSHQHAGIHSAIIGRKNDTAPKRVAGQECVLSAAAAESDAPGENKETSAVAAEEGKEEEEEEEAGLAALEQLYQLLQLQEDEDLTEVAWQQTGRGRCYCACNSITTSTCCSPSPAESNLPAKDVVPTHQMNTAVPVTTVAVVAPSASAAADTAASADIAAAVRIATATAPARVAAAATSTGVAAGGDTVARAADTTAGVGSAAATATEATEVIAAAAEGAPKEEDAATTEGAAPAARAATIPFLFEAPDRVSAARMADRLVERHAATADVGVSVLAKHAASDPLTPVHSALDAWPETASTRGSRASGSLFTGVATKGNSIPERDTVCRCVQDNAGVPVQVEVQQAGVCQADNSEDNSALWQSFSNPFGAYVVEDALSGREESSILAWADEASYTGKPDADTTMKEPEGEVEIVRRAIRVHEPAENTAGDDQQQDVTQGHHRRGNETDKEGMMDVQVCEGANTSDIHIPGLWVISQSGRMKIDYGPRVNFKKRRVKVETFHGFPSFVRLLLQRFFPSSLSSLCGTRISFLSSVSSTTSDTSSAAASAAGDVSCAGVTSTAITSMEMSIKSSSPKEITMSTCSHQGDSSNAAAVSVNSLDTAILVQEERRNAVCLAEAGAPEIVTGTHLTSAAIKDLSSPSGEIATKSLYGKFTLADSAERDPESININETVEKTGCSIKAIPAAKMRCNADTYRSFGRSDGSFSKQFESDNNFSFSSSSYADPRICCDCEQDIGKDSPSSAQHAADNVSLPVEHFYPVELCFLDYSPTRGSHIDEHIDDTWLWGPRLLTFSLAGSTFLSFVSPTFCMPLSALRRHLKRRAVATEKRRSSSTSSNVTDRYDTHRRSFNIRAGNKKNEEYERNHKEDIKKEKGESTDAKHRSSLTRGHALVKRTSNICDTSPNKEREGAHVPTNAVNCDGGIQQVVASQRAHLKLLHQQREGKSYSCLHEFEKEESDGCSNDSHGYYYRGQMMSCLQGDRLPSTGGDKEEEEKKEGAKEEGEDEGEEEEKKTKRKEEEEEEKREGGASAGDKQLAIVEERASGTDVRRARTTTTFLTRNTLKRALAVAIPADMTERHTNFRGSAKNILDEERRASGGEERRASGGNVDDQIFVRVRVEIRIPLPARSMAIVTGAARHKWAHAIRAHHIQERRVALTLRELSAEFLQGRQKQCRTFPVPTEVEK